MKKGKKTKQPVFPLLLGILLIGIASQNWQQTMRMFSILFDSTPTYLRRYFAARPMDFVYPAALILGVVVLFFSIRRMMNGVVEKQGSLTGKKDHTHDRTDAVAFDRNESQADHYIKQLDGFLKAGIIDRAEYSQLIRRYKN